jgi:putative GTP pyrophosphokinase
MADSEQWLAAIIPLHRRLTDVTVELVRNLLHTDHIDFLSVTGRTKDISSAIEKIKRKKYKDPQV